MTPVTRIFTRITLMLFILLQLGAAPVFGRAALPTAPEPARLDQTLTGTLDIFFGDPQPGKGQPITLFQLTPTSGQPIRLDMQEPLPLPWDQLMALRGQEVRVTGSWIVPAAPQQGFQVSALSGDPRSPSRSLAAVTGSQPWASLLCKFADIAAEPKPPSFFSGMYANSYPGLDHYWREVSYDQINLVGSQSTAVWYTLPKPRSYYVHDNDGDGVLNFEHTLAANDCTAVADAEINFSQLVGINLMFNSDLDGYAWGGGRYMTLDGVTKLFKMTWEPPWGYQNVTVMAHEMGHGFGLPHSSGQYGQTYDNVWDVMSDSWANCAAVNHPTYACVGQQTIAYHRDMLGWIPPARKAMVYASSQATLTLEPLENAPAGNYMMAQIPIDGSATNFYTVEVRRKLGYDVKLPAEAVIIHEVNTGRGNRAQVIDIDGNGNTGDGGAQWLVGETFTDAAHNITVSVNSVTANGGFVVTINNGSLSPECPPVIQYWKGEYWANDNLSGLPATCRDDFALSFDWQAGAPSTGLPDDYFSARWTRTLNFPAGPHRFWLLHDDGVRLYVDNMTTPVLDTWGECCQWNTVEVDISAGAHTIRVEYREVSGDAEIHLFWEPVEFQFWRAEFFNHTEKSVPPILVRDDPEINFDWQDSSPDPLVQADHFFAYWIRDVWFDAGSYRFDLYHDDGARVWIDGQLAFEDWCSDCVEDDTFTRALTSGYHLVEVELYENVGWSGISFDWALLDPYEPDNTPETASTILPGEVQIHSIDPADDVDYVKFEVLGDARVLLKTEGNTGADTRLWLYDEALQEIDFDDNGGDGLYSRIERACGPNMLPPGTYYARVDENQNDQVIPSYRLALQVEDCPLFDLAVADMLYLPNPGQVGQPLTYKVQIANQGTSDIEGEFKVDLFVDSQPSACGQTGAKTWTVPGLPAGAITELVYDSPGFNTGGQHQVLVFVDSACQVLETDEDNNQTGLVFTLLPAGFSKTSPGDMANPVATPPTLTWAAAAGAEAYAYCIDRSDDDECNGGWTTVAGTSITINSLSFNQTYYWQVRALSEAGATSANGGDWWQLTTQNLPPSCNRAWQTAILVEDAIGGTGRLDIGQGAAYTNALNTACGEALLPPPPPLPAFDARLVLPNGTQETLTDFRATEQTLTEWLIRFQSGSAPFTFRWDPQTLPAGNFRLQSLSDPLAVDVDMKAQSEYTLALPDLRELKIVYTYVPSACVNVSVVQGWNLLSVPVQAVNMQLGTLFPAVVPPAYGYTGTYYSLEPVDPLQTGRGYWLWFESPANYEICGQTVTEPDVPVLAGWNLIAPFHQAAAVSGLTSTPAAILAPPLYGFTANYEQAASLLPGRGYWAYANQSGVLHLASAKSGPAFDPSRLPSAQSAGTPQDFRLPLALSSGSGHMTLTLGVAPLAGPGYDPGLDLLAPPAPPAGAFDARLKTTQYDFLSDLRASSPAPIEFVLRFQPQAGQNNIRLTWDKNGLARLGTFTLVDLSGSQFSLDMTTTGELTITPQSILAGGLKIIVTPSNQNQFIYLPTLVR